MQLKYYLYTLICSRLSNIPSQLLKSAAGLCLLLFVTACSNKLEQEAAMSTTPEIDISRYVSWSNGEVIDLRDELNVREKTLTVMPVSRLVRTGTIHWQITYQDIELNYQQGFDDPDLGLARQQAFEQTLASLADLLNLNHTATLSVRVDKSINIDNQTLARAGTLYQSGTEDFLKGHAANHLQTGSDPDPLAPDLVYEFNFFHQFHLESSPPPTYAYDFRSVVLHETGHALGMASLVKIDGTSKLTLTNPGLYSYYDQYLANSNIRPITVLPGRYIGTAQDLVGASGELAWLGPKTRLATGTSPRLHTPSIYDAGSSISHLSTKGSSALMQPSIRPGQTKRNFTDREVLMLRDLGYAQAASPLSQLLGFAAEKTFKSSTTTNTSVVQQFDDQPGADLLTVTNDTLTVYSNLDRNRPYSYKLGSSSNFKSANAVVGPNQYKGIVISGANQESLLALGGLKLPSSGRTLETSDFSHIHRVNKKRSALKSFSNDDPTLPIVNIDQKGKQDVLTFTPNRGVLSYLNDGRGYFDRLVNFKQTKDLRITNPLLGLSVFDSGNPLPHIELAFGLGYNGQDIATFDLHRDQEGRRVRSNSFDGYRLENLSRYGVVGVAELNSTRQNKSKIARINARTPERYQIESSFPIFAVSDIAIIEHPRLAIVSSNEGHSLYKFELTGNTPPVKLAGLKQGYRDGRATNAEFNSPMALCAKERTVYVVDWGNALIRTVNVDTGLVTTLAGNPSVRTQQDGKKGVGSFAFGSGVVGAHTCAVVGESLFVLDSNSSRSGYTLRKVNINNGYITTVSPDQLPLRSYPKFLTQNKHTLYLAQGADTIHLEMVSQSDNARRDTIQGKSTRTADINRDGKPDALVLLADRYRALNYYAQQEDGSFRLQRQLSFDQAPTMFEPIHIDQDGNEDLVVAFPSGVRVYRGDGKGGFFEDANRRLAISTGIDWLSLIDINKDGQLDLTALKTSNHWSVWLADEHGHWGNGIGNHGEDYTIQLPNTDYGSFELRDFNEDGWLDLLLRGYFNTTTTVLIGEAPK